MAEYPRPLPLGVRLDLMAATRLVRLFIHDSMYRASCTFVIRSARTSLSRPSPLWWCECADVTVKRNGSDDLEQRVERQMLVIAYLNGVIERLEETYFEPGGVFVTRDACWNKTP